MSYKDRFGVTTIRDNKIDHLRISWDCDYPETDPSEKRHPVFLFVPDYDQEDHWHIELTRQEALELRNWLNDYIKDSAS